MYEKILVTLDATPTDRAIIQHIKLLAKTLGSTVVLLHVADGWAARTFAENAISAEIQEDEAYLKKICDEFLAAEIPTEAELAYGEPVKEIIRWVEENHCDLVAMSMHGHRLVADFFMGTTVTKVRHRLNVPLLLIKAR